jgi:uncharacterized protein (DUF433 family)
MFSGVPIFSVEGYIVRHIIANPEILGGKPIVEGTRLSVDHILGLLGHGMSHAEIVEAYPELTVEDVNAVIRYAAEALHNDVLIEVKTTRETD